MKKHEAISKEETANDYWQMVDNYEYLELHKHGTAVLETE